MSASDFNAEAFKQEEALDEDDELNEVLQMGDAGRSAWMLKVPDFLYHRWARASANGDDRLGTLRMHPARRPGESGTFTVVLPEQLGRPQIDQSSPDAVEADEKMLAHAIPTEYEIMIINEHSTNLYVFGENEPQPAGPSKKRKRDPFLAGTIKHECNVKPAMNAEYKRIMQQRADRAAEPKRKLKLMEGSAAELNRAAAGIGDVNSLNTFKGFVRGQKGRGGDKTIRLPKPELEVALFQLYDEKAYWGLQEAAGRLHQPLAWIKEVLGELGQIVNHGPYKGQYALRSAFRGRAPRLDLNEAGPDGQKMEEDEEDQIFDEIA